MSENPVVSLTHGLSEDVLRLHAWLGDAVLGLYMRRRIAEKKGKIDTPAFIEVTSNQFLSSFGAPTKVEAQIGIIYQRDGLEAVESFLDAEIWPRAERRILAKSSKR